jgi:hypothetical protein
MIVLSAGGNLVAGQASLTAEEAAAMQAERNRIHASYAARSTRGVRRDVPGAEHFIQQSNPAAVVAAVDEIVKEVRVR